MSNYKVLKAIKIDQPLSPFYLTKIKASELLQISFSEELQYVDDQGRLKGSQRKIDDKRLKEIARFVDSVEMSFPNSIILAANYNKDGEVVYDENLRWKLNDKDPECVEITIPTNNPLAAIIDGQHRLKAFKYIKNSERNDTEIPCSIFFDLPNSYQAFLFATINGNQKKVDKSLALEQFGFNVEDEPEKSWTPEKLAVYFSRKLNLEKSSPLYHHIKVAPIDDKLLLNGTDNWKISTATIVDGILGLISSKPKRDRVEMGQEKIFSGRDRKMLKDFKDGAPLRIYYIESKDDVIYEIVVKYFKSARETLLNLQPINSYLTKTVGIQALFDFLKKVLLQNSISSTINFVQYLERVKNVNFSDNYFQASGVGRSRIRKILLYSNGLSTRNDYEDDELAEFKRLMKIR